MSIRVERLVKRFAGKAVVDGVSFELKDGEFVSLLGPSGCGKTTTLRCIAGLEAPDEGRISIAGEVVCDPQAGLMVPPNRRNIGMVFQSYAIWPHMTVFENVAFPLRIRRMKREEIEARVTRVLELVGLTGFRDRSSQQLSGGQQQRIAVARAIVQSPAAMLFDEPLSNLDAKLRDRTRAEIRRLQRELNVSTVYVTHDQAEALSLSDRVLVMSEGRIMQDGTPREVYVTPGHEFVADVVGPANFLDVELSRVADGIVAALDGGGSLRLAASDMLPGRRRMMVRPDRIEIAPGDAADGNALSGVVRQRLFLGGHFEYAIGVGGSTVRVFSQREVDEAARVTLRVAPEDCVILAGDAQPLQGHAR
jgi:ABC-type Fe3+/spermidine/putrescine transport system ATPase subunit